MDENQAIEYDRLRLLSMFPYPRIRLPLRRTVCNPPPPLLFFLFVPTFSVSFARGDVPSKRTRLTGNLF